MSAVFLTLLALFSGGNVEECTLVQLQDRLARGGDTTFVVNFWATWCKPCVEELPAFDQLSRTYRNEKMKVILVSLDNPAERETKVAPFIRKKGYDVCDVVLLNESKPHLWIDRVDQSWSGSIPATLFLNGTHRLFGEFQFSTELLDTTFTRFRREVK